MLQSPKFLQSSATKFLSPTLSKQQSPNVLPQKLKEPPKSQSFFPTLTLNQCCKFSRRDLAFRSHSLLLLLFGFRGQLSNAKAAENSEDTIEIELQEDGTSDTITVTSIEDIENGSNSITNTDTVDICNDKSITKRAFLDIAIDGEPVGKIVIGLYGNSAPFGATRFGNLVSGKSGVTYRRKEFVKILPNYVQHGGVRSYGVDAELARRSGGSLEADDLVGEWERANEKCPGTKSLAGTVSIIVRDPLRPPPKTKLVAKDGKLEIGEEEVRSAPNGTGFVISLKDSPELDDSALVVGRVLEGAEVVERIGQVKSVNENTSSPYFRVAKLIGDTRATVAERGFNRPYSKIVVTNCGLIE